MPTDDGEYQSEVSVDVFVHGCKVLHVAGVGITAVEKDECRLQVRLDDRLHVSRRGYGGGDAGTKASVELDWMNVLLYSDEVQP